MSVEIDRYVVERELGRGAFGAVYVARHKVIGARVALKVLHSVHAQDPVVVDRFLREARAAASIGSPHIVRVTDAGVTPDQRAFLAMELLEGEDLASYLSRRGRLATSEAIGITSQVLAGLGAAHAAGIVHRDMKPANVFLTRDERGAPLVKILDFGVSKMKQQPGMDGSLTATGTIVGTPHYMAPEQLVESHHVDGRADLYSVGVMLYELVSGRLPYHADSFGALFKDVLMTAPPPISAVAPDVPYPVAAVIERALVKEPAARFAGAREMYDALQLSVSGVTPAPFPAAIPSTVAGTPMTLPMGGVSGTGALAPPSTVAPRRRSLVPLIALGALLSTCILAMGIGAVLARHRLSAAWSALLGEPVAASDDPSIEPAAREPEREVIPMHDGTEEVVGNAGISVERCARRRAEDGRWIVDMPITLRNAGENGLTFQQSELEADGYIATAESDLPTLAMFAPGRSISGYMVWRAAAEGAPPETITIRFRGWARRVPVTDGPRLPPRPAPL